MAFKESTGFCEYCNRQVLTRKEVPSKTLFFLAIVFTAGLAIIFWILANIRSGFRKYRCTSCGQLIDGRCRANSFRQVHSSRSYSPLQIVAAFVGVFFVIGIVSSVVSRSVKVDEEAKAKSSAPISSSNVSATSTYPKERIRRGEQLVKRANGKYKINPDPIIGGMGTNILVYLPVNEWKKLSREEQMDVSIYAESLVPQVRTNPSKYVDVPKSAPLYSTFIQNASRMCATCWSVEIGSVVKRDNGQNTILGDEESPVNGNNASAFRQVSSR